MCYNHYWKFLVNIHFPAQTFFRNNFIFSLNRLSCFLGSSAYTCGKFSMPKFAIITCFVPQEQCLCSRSVTSALPNHFVQGCASEDLKKRWKQHLCRALGICDSSCNKTRLSWILNPLQTHEQKWSDWFKVCSVHYLNSRTGKRRKNKPKLEKSETLD